MVSASFYPFRRGQDLFDPRQHDFLQSLRRNRLDRARFGAVLDRLDADIVAVDAVLLAFAARRHGVAVRIFDDAFQKVRPVLVALEADFLRRVAGQDLLRRVPERLVDDRRMLPLVDPASGLVADFSDIDRVAQNAVQAGLGEGFRRIEPAARGRPAFRGDVFGLQITHQRRGRAQRAIALENIPDALGFLLVYDQFTAYRVVSQRHDPAGPHAFLFAGGQLVADPLGGDLTLELREGL